MKKAAPRRPQRGDIWWLEDELTGRRPVLVLTRTSIIEALAGVVVAPITRTVRSIDSEITLDIEDGMRERCAASFDNLRTVPKSMLSQFVTRLNDVRIHELCLAIDFALECD